MNTTLRIILSWLSVMIAVAFVVVGSGLWVVLAAVLLDLVLRRLMHPQIPFLWDSRGRSMDLPLMLIFIFAIVAASGSDLTFIRISACSVAGGIVLWSMIEELRVRRRMIHENIA